MINCKDYVTVKKEELRNKLLDCDYKRRPRLTVIQIGNNPASNSYIKGKRKDCEEVGIAFDLVNFPETITHTELCTIVKHLSLLDSVDGLILQLPVPDHINVKEIQELINPAKDVDGFNKYSTFDPCTPLGVINYLKHNRYIFEGKNALVIGRSDIVGKPLARMLTDLNCTVTLAHSRSKLRDILDYQDIIFTCIDKIEYFDETYFGAHQDIIDIGLGKSENGKLKGNLSSAAVRRLSRGKCNILISGIGGVGLLTRLELLNNTFKAYRRKI